MRVLISFQIKQEVEVLLFDHGCAATVGESAKLWSCINLFQTVRELARY